MRSRRGSSLIEFTLVGVPVIFIMASIVEASIGSWQFFTMEYAIQTANRYVSTHGRGCTQNSNNCALTVGAVATMIANQAIALEPSKLNVTLITASTTQTCNPVNTCFSNTAQFPSSTDNGVNQDVTIKATYPIVNPVSLLWPGAMPVTGSMVTLGATSRQRIQF